MQREEVCTGIWWRNPRERDHVEGQGLAEKIILK